MDNSTILAWIFTALLLIVGYMLGKHSRINADKKKNAAKNATKTKVLIFANDILYSEKEGEICVYQQNIAVLTVLIEKYDVYVAVHVEDETKGKAIRNELLEAGLNSIQKAFFPEVGNGEKILLFTDLSSIKPMAEILGIDILITNSEKVRIIQTMLEKSTIQVLEQSANSFNMEF